ncbi:hypothetical protein KA005_63755 [bacterium]|nr:hypothetical protein [bacterium]
MKNIRGAKTKDYLVSQIILLKKGDNTLTAGGIRKKLIELHPGSKSVPKERAIYKIIERNKDKIQPSDLDNPWSLGSCRNNDISPDVIIPIQQQLLHYGRFLTIRRACWYSLLHPILFPLLEKAYPEQENQIQVELFQIASYYTRMEQLAEIKGEPLDTRDLDETFIFNQDFSLKTSLRVWNSLYRHIPQRPSKVMREKASTLTPENILGEEMSESEARLLNKFIKSLCAYDTDEGDLEKAISIAEKNPEIQPFVKKWMAFSLRRDIKISKKDGAK